MSYKLSNGKISLSLKWDAHFKKKFKGSFTTTNKKTGQTYEVKLYAIKIEMADITGTYIKMPNWYIQSPPWEKNIKGTNPTYNMIIDPAMQYPVYKIVQGDEREICKLNGHQIITYFDAQEKEREAYKLSEKISQGKLDKIVLK